MPHCVFRRSDGVYESGAMHTELAFDPATFVQLVLATYPDRRTQRWDGGTGVRAATAQELTAYDTARLDGEATAMIDRKELLAVILYVREQLNVIRQAMVPPLPTLTLAAVRTGIIDKYKAL